MWDVSFWIEGKWDVDVEFGIRAGLLIDAWPIEDGLADDGKRAAGWTFYLYL